MRTITRENLPDLLLAVLVLIVLAFALSRTAADPDLWGHVRFGQDILAAQSIPRHDTYSFTSDRPWVNHEWLAEVVMAGAYDIAGSAGLVALKVLLTMSAFAILWRGLRHAGVRRPLAVVLLLVGIVGAYAQTMTVRPQLFSMLLYTVMLALLGGIGRGHSRLFLWMPGLFALWANLHGGWIVGLGVLLLWTACGVLARTIPVRWAVVGVLLGLLGTMATPYGFDLWRFLWETVGLGRADNSEWQPLMSKPHVLIPWGLTVFLIVAAWRLRGPAAAPLLVPTAMLGALAFRVVRLEGFFALTGALMLAPAFAAHGPDRLPLSKRPSRNDIVAAGAMCLAGLLATGIAVKDRVGCVTLTGSGPGEPWAPDAEAVTFLQRNPINGRLLCFFDYGEMAIWHLAPRLLVSYDGRRETVYSATVQADHMRFYFNTNDASYARALKADYIWLPRRLPVVGPLERDGWVAIFRGSASVVFAREAGRYMQPAPWTGPRCFPGP